MYRPRELYDIIFETSMEANRISECLPNITFCINLEIPSLLITAKNSMLSTHPPVFFSEKAYII